MATVGRKKEYKNAAERQRAYRLRKKNIQNSSELRITCDFSLKMRLERLCAYNKLTKLELIEKLLNAAEDATIKTIMRDSGDLSSYMNIEN